MEKAKRTFKPTVRVSKGGMKYRKWSEYAVGDVVLGKYVSTHTDNYDKENPVIEVLEAFFKDKSAEDYLGKRLVLNSCGTLDSAMKDVKVGQIIQVTYNGTSTIEKGKFKGKDAHSLDVDVMEEADEDSVNDEDLV